MLASLKHARDNNALVDSANLGDTVHDEAELVESVNERGRLCLDGREVLQPGERDEHVLRSLKLLEETDVVDLEVALIVDLVADLGEAVDAEAKSEPGPLLGIYATRTQHVGV